MFQPRAPLLFSSNAAFLLGGQVSILVQTKRSFAERVSCEDDLVKVGDLSVQELTLADLTRYMTTPTIGVEGYNVQLSFRKSDGTVYRIPGETLKVVCLEHSD